MARVLTVAVAACLTATSAAAQDISEDDRYRWYNHCRPIWLEVTVNEPTPPITLAAVQAAFESRLRAARLYTNEPPLTNPDLSISTGHLLVNVSLLDDIFNVTVQFRKPLYDPATSMLGTFGGTWQVGYFGTGLEQVMPMLAQTMDQFIADYLRVNEEACDP